MSLHARVDGFTQLAEVLSSPFSSIFLSLTNRGLVSRSEKEVEDVVDSDFDIDETDEVKSDQEDADTKRPRRAQKGVVTKAYKVGAANLWICDPSFHSYLILHTQVSHFVS